MMQDRMPFTISKTENFFDKLSEWIGDVFYDILPENGLELRDEQIYMAFQLERAFKEKEIMFAEAGVGTGKTIVYLLYALCYARYVGKPAIITCADESLIEQLVKKEGDIAKLSNILQLNMDVRLAKSQDQYLCIPKLENAMANHINKAEEIYFSLPDFVHEHASLKSFHPYGDRKDYPNLSDQEWDQIACDRFLDYSSYELHNRCGHTLFREYYRKARDLIICSHDFYMEHVWTKESRKREGQLPLLPDASCVVFDEGHLLEFAAQKALTYRVKEAMIESLLTRLLENDVREQFAHLIENAIETNQSFFDLLKTSSEKVAGSNRRRITSVEDVKVHAKKLLHLLIEIGDQLVFESEMYTIDHYQLNIVDEYLDQMEFSLNLFLTKNEAITWLEIDDEEYTLVIMPQAVEEIMKENVFSNKMPFVFSSATLSENDSFDYIAKSLGIKKYLSFHVDSPYNYDEQMEIYMPMFHKDDTVFAEKYSYTMKQLHQTGGRALILFSTMEELVAFKHEAAKQDTEFSFLFEGEQEISKLISTFQNKEETVLCAVHLWEGLDIPGPSLSNIIIWSLPYPPNDPVFEAKRKTSEQPFWDIDMPYMILRLKQGIGRLIRSSEDQGIISILVTDDLTNDLKETIYRALPTFVNQ